MYKAKKSVVPFSSMYLKDFAANTVVLELGSATELNPVEKTRREGSQHFP